MIKIRIIVHDHAYLHMVAGNIINESLNWKFFRVTQFTLVIFPLLIEIRRRNKCNSRYRRFLDKRVPSTGKRIWSRKFNFRIGKLAFCRKGEKNKVFWNSARGRNKIRRVSRTRGGMDKTEKFRTTRVSFHAICQKWVFPPAYHFSHPLYFFFLFWFRDISSLMATSRWK